MATSCVMYCFYCQEAVKITFLNEKMNTKFQKLFLPIGKLSEGQDFLHTIKNCLTLQVLLKIQGFLNIYVDNKELN